MPTKAELQELIEMLEDMSTRDLRAELAVMNELEASPMSQPYAQLVMAEAIRRGLFTS